MKYNINVIRSVWRRLRKPTPTTRATILLSCNTQSTPKQTVKRRRKGRVKQ